MAMHFSLRSDLGTVSQELLDAGGLATGSFCNELNIGLQLKHRSGKRLSKKGATFCDHPTNQTGSSFGNDQGPANLRFPDLSFGANWTSKYKNVPTPAAVATATRLAFGEEEVKPWRLDDKLLELKELRESISNLDSLQEKLELLNSTPQVRDVFGNSGHSGFSPKPMVSYALQTFGVHDIYLLKCLVAGGQEHVLEITAGWLDDFQSPRPKTANGAGNSIEDGLDISANSVEKIGNSHLHQQFPIETRSSAHSNTNGTLSKKNGELSNGSDRADYVTASQACKELYAHVEYVNCSLERLIKVLHDMELFYDSIGGIIGYQIAALELIRGAENKEGASSARQNGRVSSSNGVTNTRFFVPVGPDLSIDKDYATQAALWGLESLPNMGEIYPLGGAGDRLGLVDEVTGECLPVAMLPYCGRTLLEGLIRDLQAREYLHFKLFGQQHTTPIAIMTSAAKKNNELVIGLCESRDWFGRGKSNFCIFEQPLIPAIAAEDGRWLISEPLAPILKPGGHGVIWKLAYDKGVFNWFYSKGRKAAIVRQISNPIAATDVTLLALAGVGCQHKKTFGFASCERKVGAAEGVNVLIERSTKDGLEYCVTCIEYTEFSKLGIPDVPVSPGSMQAQYPANTNVLFVDLPSVERVASSQSSDSLPGMILNLKKRVEFTDYLGVTHSTCAGRLECTMQNVADYLPNKCQSRLAPSQHASLDTFLVYNQRRKVTSSAKRRRKPTDVSLHQTPDGSFLDVIWNAHDLLSSCMVDIPEMESKECYVEHGPPFIVLLHPAMGPVWDVIRQKIRGGSISKGSELQLEIAEILWQDVQLEGSLLIVAENVVGSLKNHDVGERLLHYGKDCGRCRLERVMVSNRGIDWSCKENVYWQHRVQRLEAVKITLRGNAEFEAHDVTLEGPHTFDVPNGFKMSVTQDIAGVSRVLSPLPAEPSTWQWNYTVKAPAQIALQLQEN